MRIDDMSDFSSIAHYYDLMTGYSNRLIGDFGKIKNLVKRVNATEILDAGCGTGVHSVILAKLGLDVRGVDASEEMLDVARANALKEGVDVDFLQEYFESLPHSWTERFDTVLCLGNSIVGVQTGERLGLAFKAFQRVLRPQGKVVLQALNYTHFKQQDQRIIKVRSAENYTFVRFFDFGEKESRLNILTIRHDMGNVEHTLTSNKILPLNTEVLTIASKMARFDSIEFYSDLTLTEPYDPAGNDLVAVVTK